MKVLFISSGNSKNGISPIIKNQGDSLIKQGVDLQYFTIKGKGIKGYLKNIRPLRILLKKKDFHVVHAHYSMSAIVASFAGAKPLVVSLMGSDVKSNKYFKIIIKLFNKYFWSKIIVKSDDMMSSLGIKDVVIIPNGVDFYKFKPMPQADCKKELGWDLSKNQVLFAANPNRPVKNFKLAKEAVTLIDDSDIELKVLKDVPNKQMPIYHNAADIILLTSLWEGSPNVIKESMACNTPIVSTDVGDVKEVIGNTEGCYIASFEAEDVALKLRKALDFGKKTTGRYDIKHLDSSLVANRILDVYKMIYVNL